MGNFIGSMDDKYSLFFRETMAILESIYFSKLIIRCTHKEINYDAPWLNSFVYLKFHNMSLLCFIIQAEL